MVNLLRDDRSFISRSHTLNHYKAPHNHHLHPEPDPIEASVGRAPIHNLPEEDCQNPQLGVERFDTGVDLLNRGIRSRQNAGANVPEVFHEGFCAIPDEQSPGEIAAGCT